MLGPVLMDVDTLRRKCPVPGTYYRCGSMEHLVKDCPRTLDVRAIPVNEQMAMLEQLMAAVDIRAADVTPRVESDDEGKVQMPTEEDIDHEGFGLSRR